MDCTFFSSETSCPLVLMMRNLLKMMSVCMVKISLVGLGDSVILGVDTEGVLMPTGKSIGVPHVSLPFLK